MNIPASHIISTTEEAKALDAHTSEDFGLDAFTLMEVAGYTAAKIIKKKINPASKGLFLCGKGNNGGDALVAARYLIQCGFKAIILFVSGSDSLSPLTQKNYELLKKIARHDDRLKIHFLNSLAEFDTSARYNFIVDGMLGTGLNSDLGGGILKTVKWSNEQAAPCFAMDIPTGLHADSGKIMGESIKADCTCSFGTLKQGLYLNDGFKYRGEVHFCELPFPNYLKSMNTFLIDEAWMPPLTRKPAAHKYEGGVVYIIGGSEGLTGAAIMAARSAWAEGVGAVILICPLGLLPVFENNLPEVIKKPVGESAACYFKEKNIQSVLDLVQEKKGTVLIGPGLGREEETAQFVNKFLSETKRDCVIDADALWALAQQNDWQLNEASSHILTPHPGELSTLLGEAFDDDLKRLQTVRKRVNEKNITLLSKGFPIILGTPESRTYISGYDSRQFSRAGFGDVLAGKIAAFKAMGCGAGEACIRALLSGEKKIDQFKNKKPKYVPAPEDII